MTVWRGGLASAAARAALFPELFFAMFLNVVYLKGILDISLARKAQWELLARGPSSPNAAGGPA